MCDAWQNFERCKQYDAEQKQKYEAEYARHKAQAKAHYPLHVACADGDTAEVTSLLSQSRDVDEATAEDGSTPLFIACQWSHVAVVRLLLDAGADANKASYSSGLTPLHAAMMGEKMAGRKEAAAGEREQAAAEKARAAQAMVPLVRALLSAGANADSASHLNTTPLQLACGTGNAELVGMLLAAGVKPNRVQQEREGRPGQAAIHVVAEGRHLPLLAPLLAAKAEVNQKTTAGVQPLHIASQLGDAAMLTALLLVSTACAVAQDGTEIRPRSAAGAPRAAQDPLRPRHSRRQHTLAGEEPRAGDRGGQAAVSDQGPKA